MQFDIGETYGFKSQAHTFTQRRAPHTHTHNNIFFSDLDFHSFKISKHKTKKKNKIKYVSMPFISKLNATLQKKNRCSQFERKAKSK